MKLDAEKVKNTIHKYGNTSSVSVPLTIVSELKDKMQGEKKLLLSAFGVGMAWSSVYFETDNIVCPQLLLYKYGK